MSNQHHLGQKNFDKMIQKSAKEGETMPKSQTGTFSDDFENQGTNKTSINFFFLFLLMNFIFF